MEGSRRRGNIGRVYSILFSFFLLLGSKILAQQSFNQSAEYRIARGYFQQAKLLVRQGRTQPAADLLEVSLEFFPDYSESAYLLAQIYLREQESTAQAIEYLEAAVRAHTWTETQSLTAEAELIRVYVRTARFQEARRLFSAIGETGLGGRGNPDLSALWASTLIGLGQFVEAQAFLTEAVRRFPQSPRLYTLLAQVLVRRGNQREAREVLRKGLDQVPMEAELMYQLAVLERDSDRRREWVDAYYEAGGKDPGAAVLVIQGGVEDEERYIDLFFSLGGNTRISYLDRLLESISPQEISERTGGYTGTRIMDRNRDGYYEQRFEYRNGILSQWVCDEDQNGIAEAIVDFEGGIPRKLALPAGESSSGLQYEYGEYPFIESASFVSDTTRREYRMVPFVVQRPAFVSIPGEGFALQRREDLKAGEDFIRQNAYQRMEYVGSSPFPERRVHLLKGRTVRVDELPDSAGTFTHTLFYTSSQPVEGIRDLDGDGNPEIREQFRNGRLWKITLDQDGDGVNEFEQVFEGELKQMYWDYRDSR
jgi:tetratricopeptide (TPR) repeat protein